MSASPTDVLAILSAYNEEDVVGEVLDHLRGQGVAVYFIDDGSSDATARIAEARLGRGVVHVERRPPSPVFDWEALLRRKQEIAREWPAAWYIHHDADEFRESPWPGSTLAQAIAQVDAWGYNAIDFEVFTFALEEGEAGGSPAALRHVRPTAEFDRVQVKCWKRTDAALDLVSSGGHAATFEGRRVCPIRFLLRHYPLRSRQQAERKVFRERLGRLRPEERARGWHVQYDGLEQGGAARVAGLSLFDPDRARLGALLRHREYEELEARAAAEEARLRAEAADLLERTRVLGHHLEATRLILADRERSVAALEAMAAELRAELGAARGHHEEAVAALEAAHAVIRAIEGSVSWRVTRPLRALADALARLRQG